MTNFDYNHHPLNTMPGTRPASRAELLDRYSTAYASNRYRDLCFYTARSYSLMRPPRTARRLIYSTQRTATG